MGFFDFLKKSAEPAAPAAPAFPVTLAADAKGTVVAMENIPDEVFAQGILGKCCGIDPTEGKIYAPADGEITQAPDSGHALDDGEPCVCVQGISYSLLCNWFRNAVLPADHELLADVMRERPGKRCAVCGKPVYSSSNRAKYCPACAKQERRKQDAKRKREQYWNLRK